MNCQTTSSAIKTYSCSFENCGFETENYYSLCNHVWSHTQSCELCLTNQLTSLRAWKKHLKTKKHNRLMNSMYSETQNGTCTCTIDKFLHSSLCLIMFCSCNN